MINEQQPLTLIDEGNIAVVVLKTTNGAMVNYNYLVVDKITRQGVLVDPAWQIDVIEQAVVRMEADIKGVLVTHNHPDHIHLASTMAGKYGCPIWLSEQEIIATGYRDVNLQAIDETPWSIGQMEICPILTPGHTPGCICFQIGNGVFTGDVLFAEGCGICFDIPSAHQMFASLEYLKAILPLQSRIFPGHCYVKSPGQRFADVLGNNMYLQFDNKESFAAYRLRPGQSQRRILDFR